jgi:hypothetical protein
VSEAEFLGGKMGHAGGSFSGEGECGSDGSHQKPAPALTVKAALYQEKQETKARLLAGGNNKEERKDSN